MKTVQRDASISLIRLIATVFIVSCHFMQFFDMELAWWFNVGVQIFLCLSGYLYGKRGVIDDEFAFYKKNAVKILVDYYIVVLPVILIYAMFFAENLSLSIVAKALITYGTLPGGEHLWYIPLCLFCYLLTPFLSRLFERSKYKHSVKCFVLMCLAVILVCESFFGLFK